MALPHDRHGVERQRRRGEAEERHDVLVVHDNAYSETTYDGYIAPSFLQTPGAKEVGVEVFSLSKGYNMTGWRCAAIVGNAAAIEQYWRLKSNVDSGNFEAVQLAGAAALAPEVDAEVKAMNEVYKRRRDLVWLAATQPLGVVAQAVIGGIVVLTKLNPVAVSVHFLVSASVLAAAVVLHARCTDSEADGPPVRRDLRVICGALVAVTCLMLAAGTVVTGTGPLAGDAGVPRYQLPLVGVTQLHADIGWLLAGLSVAMVLGLRLSGAPRRAVRAGWVMLAALGVRASSATSSTSPTSRPGWSGST